LLAGNGIQAEDHRGRLVVGPETAMGATIALVA
jgi:hypothetical protein